MPFQSIITVARHEAEDAAKVFDRLEMSVLYEIASKIAPRKMCPTSSADAAEAAERLTVELARRAGPDKSSPPTAENRARC